MYCTKTGVELTLHEVILFANVILILSERIETDYEIKGYLSYSMSKLIEMLEELQLKIMGG